jgi:DNA-binding NtrC family response regulator
MCPVKTEKPNWKKIARRAAQERDPDKLLAIIEELNAALEARANERRARLYAPPGHRIGKRLLFVDDEPNIRLTLPPVLEQHGFQVQVAASLFEALAAIRNHTFDVVLSDLNINAEGDGFTVIYTAHEANPACVTILLTGYPAFETALQAFHTEVDDYFVKPADIAALLSTIERKLFARASLESLRESHDL